MLRLDADLGARRRLIGVGHAGELLDLTAERLLVETLDVPARALLDGRVDEHLDKRAVLLDHRARPVARLRVRRDRRHDHCGSVAREPRRDPADAVDVRVAVLLREAEPLGQVLTHLVAVEPLDEEPAPLELGADELGDRGLAGP